MAINQTFVTVSVPDVKPEKHALDQKDNKKVLDGQEVQIGQYIRYLLDGVTVTLLNTTASSNMMAVTSWMGFMIDSQASGKVLSRDQEYTATKDLVLPS